MLLPVLVIVLCEIVLPLAFAIMLSLLLQPALRVLERWYLPRMLGWAKASELIFTGRTLTAQQSLEITQFSYSNGAASLLDFLDAERSYRATELTYRQALASYMSSLEQLRTAVGSRDLQ